MGLTGTMRGRRSIRRFKEKEVPREVVEEILETARWAPSGNNVQPWRFIIVVNREKKAELSRASDQRWIAASPMVIVCLSDLDVYGEFASYSALQSLVEVGMIEDMGFDEFKERKEGIGELENRTANTINSILNVAIIIDHITLLAHESGLGTCWVRYFNIAAVRRTLDVPDNYALVALLPIGYPDESGRRKERQDVESLVLRWE
jgi:nitroreductase